jgi:hypothetical protein
MPRGNGPKRQPFKAAFPAPRKAKRSGAKGFPRAAANLMKARSGDLCEIGLLCMGHAQATESAHRLAKQAGGVGPKNTWSSKAANGLRACSDDHRLVDGANEGEAFRLGYKIRHGVARPVEVPVLHIEFGWVLLDDAGGWRPAPAVSYERPDGLLPVVGVSKWDLMVPTGAFLDAMERYGHINCPGWSPPREGVFTCGCGAEVFALDVIA